MSRHSRDDGFRNPFANTSLDTASPPRPPPAAPPPVVLSAATRAATDRHRRFRRESRHQLAVDEQTFELAENYITKLEEYRQGEAALKSVFLDAVRKWQDEDSPAAEAFLEFMQTALSAANTTVATFAITQWYPVEYQAVQQSLDDLVKHYHGEATIMAALHQAEENNPDRSLGFQHYEIARAASLTKVDTRATPPVVRNFVAWCGPKNIRSVAKFDCYDDDWYSYTYGTDFILERRIEKIRANFLARKILLREDAPNRWDKSNKELKFSMSIDSQVMQWNMKSFNYLDDLLSDAFPWLPDLSGEEYEALTNLSSEVTAFCEVHNFFAIAHIQNKIKVQYGASLKNFAIETDLERKVEITKHLEEMEAEFEAFEEEHGAVLEEWRFLATNRDNDFSRSDRRGGDRRNAIGEFEDILEAGEELAEEVL